MYISGQVLVISIFVGKIKLNFHYKKMTKKCMTICWRNIKIVFFRFKKNTKRLAIFILIRQIGRKYTGLCNCLKKKGHRKVFVN